MKQAQEALRKNEEKLGHYAQNLEIRVAERTAKLEESIRSLEGVLYHVAHDLRAPLRTMAAFTEMLVESAGASWMRRERCGSADRFRGQTHGPVDIGFAGVRTVGPFEIVVRSCAAGKVRGERVVRFDGGNSRQRGGGIGG